ncbi:MAG: hypothetical protein NTZ05_17970 [Chloroflexi bacterium]|nr:hypothetical protein [Chloroflexota bacterium]
MTQPLVSERFPFLPVVIRVHQMEFRFYARIDTGFTGGATLPQRLLPDELTPDEYGDWVLANETEMRIPTYDGTVQVGNFHEAPVRVIGVGDEVLIGIEVLRHFAVLLDHGQRVIVIES